jgi:hypothetical protein
MHEHFRLTNGVSEVESSSMFNNATRKVIKVTLKHARCISVATYNMQVLKQ